MVNFSSIQQVVFSVVGLLIVIVGGMVIWGGKKGDVNGSAKTLGVVVIGAIIITIGAGALFVTIGRGFTDVLFGS